MGRNTREIFSLPQLPAFSSNKNRTSQVRSVFCTPPTLPIFPALLAYSLLSDNTTIAPPCAFLLTLAATDSVESRTLPRAARRSLLVDLTTLADHWPAMVAIHAKRNTTTPCNAHFPMTDTIVLPAEFDGSNLTFKLLQEDCIQVLHQD
jgi:hypothetical protein